MTCASDPTLCERDGRSCPNLVTRIWRTCAIASLCQSPAQWGNHIEPRLINESKATPNVAGISIALIASVETLRPVCAVDGIHLVGLANKLLIKRQIVSYRSCPSARRMLCNTLDSSLNSQVVLQPAAVNQVFQVFLRNAWRILDGSLTDVLDKMECVFSVENPIEIPIHPFWHVEPAIEQRRILGQLTFTTQHSWTRPITMKIIINILWRHCRVMCYGVFRKLK